ncbi:unnamed protein product [Lymnaea stagnalis]|uniref:Kinase n=1 Tax=Lymnaea stagnalis TaxID=6523 RepID=A0AAV2IH95_LYMST
MTTIQALTVISNTPEKRLAQFDHQVAGQSLILRYDECTICKCLIHREFMFYKHMPSSLRQFVPKFKGVIQLSIEGTSSTQGRSSPDYPENTDGPDGHGQGTSIDSARLRALSKTTRVGDTEEALYNFMLLEDLMCPYKRPCILDLKVGVRQHGDDASPEKMAYQIQKCRDTTSHSLGIRLCGMKSYLPAEGKYETKDKMFGRQLDDNHLKREIINFLSNGEDLRTDLIDPILRLLKSLKTVIEALEGYRFYSCSLLIIYEGLTSDLDTEVPTLTPENFSYSTGWLPRPQHQANKNGDHQTEPDPINADLIHVVPATDSLIHDPDSLGTSTLEDHSPNGTNGDRIHWGQVSNGRKHKDPVSIRIVDFAHATFEGFDGDTVKHIGPDHGFLLGVSTLLEIFDDLKNKD